MERLPLRLMKSAEALSVLLEDLRDLNLTSHIYDKSQFPVANGGFSDVYTGIYRKYRDLEMNVAITQLRVCTGENKDFNKV